VCLKTVGPVIAAEAKKPGALLVALARTGQKPGGRKYTSSKTV